MIFPPLRAAGMAAVAEIWTFHVAEIILDPGKPLFPDH